MENHRSSGAESAAASTSPRLLRERFVVVYPSLVRAFGAEAAIVLQHIHFRIAGGQDVITLPELSEDTGLATRTIQRKIKFLREAEPPVLHVERASALDARNRFRINHDHPDLNPAAEPGAIEDAKVAHSEDAKVASSTYREKKQRSSSRANDLPELADLSPSQVEELWKWMREHRGAKIPKGLFRSWDSSERRDALAAFQDHREAVLEMTWFERQRHKQPIDDSAWYTDVPDNDDGGSGTPAAPDEDNPPTVSPAPRR